MERNEIEELRNEGILDYLYSHCHNEDAEIVLQLFLNNVLQNHSEQDIDDLTNLIIEQLEELEEE